MRKSKFVEKMTTKIIIQLLFVLFLFAIPTIVNGVYYCTHFLYESGQSLCPPATPPLAYYASVHLCCKRDNQLGNATIYRTFEMEPPQTFPAGCTPAIQNGNGQHLCLRGADAFGGWDPTFADVIPVCCPSGSAPPQGTRLSTLHLGAGGQQLQGTAAAAGGGTAGQVWPPSVWSPGGRSPSTGGGSSLCRDLFVPNRASDCPANWYRCRDPLWRSTMALQCPLTCGLCTPLSAAAAAAGQLAAPAAAAGVIGPNHVGGGRGCADWISPSGTPSCADKVALNDCQLHPNRMQIQCPVSCGFC